jgi:hypothetical protein
MPQAATIPSDAVRFSMLATNMGFYFLADTAQSFLWVKTSATTASNTVNQKSAKIPATTFVRSAAGGGGGPSPSPALGESPPVDREMEARYRLRYGTTNSSPVAPAAPAPVP